MTNKDKLYDFVGSGWEYLITLKFSPDKVNTNDDNMVEELWSKFVFSCKRNNPDCAYLVFNENSVIQYHMLMSDIDLQLIPVTDKNGKALKDRFGNAIFEVGIWEYGFGVAIELPKDENYYKVMDSFFDFVIGRTIGIDFEEDFICSG